jgi:hypothetical protein
MQIVDSILFWANATPARPAIIQPPWRADLSYVGGRHHGGGESFHPVPSLIRETGRGCDQGFSSHVGREPWPPARGFQRCAAQEKLLAHVPLTGADTLVSEHGGLVWTDRTTILFNDALDECTKAGAVAPVAARDGDMIFFTSGSTGRPKMIVHYAASAVPSAFSFKALAVREFERALVVPSLTQLIGFIIRAKSCDLGKTVALPPSGSRRCSWPTLQ